MKEKVSSGSVRWLCRIDRVWDKGSYDEMNGSI